MVLTTGQTGADATVQQHGDELFTLNRRPSRRASTFDYGPPSAPTSDSDSSASSVRVVDVSRGQTRENKDPWYKKMRRARNKANKKENRTLPPPPPIHLAQANDDSVVVIEEAGERVSRRRSGGAFWRPNRGRRAENFTMEEHHSGAPRRRWYDTGAPPTQSRFSTLGALFGKRRTMSTTISGSSYYYSEYTDSSDVEETVIKLRVSQYRIEESGVRIDTDRTSFDLSNFRVEVTGSERSSISFRKELAVAFTDAYTQQTPNNVKLILIQNDEEAMSNVIRNVFSDSPWFSRYGRELDSRVNSFRKNYQSGSPTKKIELFRILHDKERNMVQSAFCINHWVIPLENNNGSKSPQSRDEADRLQQLIVYWQYKWSDGKKKQEVEGKSTTGASVRDGDQLEISTEAAATPVAAPTSSTHKKTNKSAVVTKNVDETKEPLFRSNLIVVFERSQVNTRYKRSIVLDNLSDIMCSSNFFIETNKEASIINSKERLIGLQIAQLSKYVIENVCDSLTKDLDNTIDSSFARRARLAEEVYQKPDDDSLASKLWEYSRAFQNSGKIISLFALLVDDIRAEFARHLEDERLSKSFLAHLPFKFRNLAIDVEEELQKPVAEMIDLVYKSVSIKDARRSLELNSSLWRLSWVTFIFLPLTFLVGFFGMNVDTFAKDPSIKWYFIAAVPLLIFVTISWLLFKCCVKRQSSGKPGLLLAGATAMTLLFLGIKPWSRTRSRSKIIVQEREPYV